MSDKLKPSKVPCGSCPYRKDVPAGIWAAHEYDKLPAYDWPMHMQPPAMFYCHQNDGHICGGWLACHGPNELLAVRIADRIFGELDPCAYAYDPKMPLFASGREACDHGKAGIRRPGRKAKHKIAGLMKRRGLE